MRHRQLPPTTQPKIDALYAKHDLWVQQASTKRDSLLIGFSILACGQPSWGEVESLIFDGTYDGPPGFSSQYTREQLVDLYVREHSKPILEK